VDPDTAEKTKTLTDQDIVAQTAVILIAGRYVFLSQSFISTLTVLDVSRQMP
jgi:hypothetical protein